MTLKSDYPAATMAKGRILLRLGRDQEALDAFDKAVDDAELDPGAWYGQGLTLAALGRSDEAVKSFDEALARLPSYTEALAAKGMALAHLRRTEESKSLLCQAWEKRAELADRGAKVAETLRGQEVSADACGSLTNP
jgi:tetratricopeptide (TPR) repeat protein